MVRRFQDIGALKNSRWITFEENDAYDCMEYRLRLEKRTGLHIEKKEG
jgi:hypothetical protein